MNRELLAQVRDQILAETDKFNMGQWVTKAKSPQEVRDGAGELDEDGGSCGTTACLAGWALTLDALHQGYGWESTICRIRFDQESEYIGDAAARVLDLPLPKKFSESSMRTCELFLMETWPERYIKMLELEPGDDPINAPAAAQAKVAAELISDLLDGFAYFDDNGKLCDLQAEMDEIVEEQADA